LRGRGKGIERERKRTKPAWGRFQNCGRGKSLNYVMGHYVILFA
jgi:hypothetical protein